MHHQGTIVDAASPAEDRVDGAVVQDITLGVERLARIVGNRTDVHVHLEHTFTSSAYIRSGWVPAGTLIVGGVLSEAVPLIILSGEAAVVSDGIPHGITGPWATVSKPGSRRLIYAVTDCYCLNALMSTGESVADIEGRILQEKSCLSQELSPSLASACP